MASRSKWLVGSSINKTFPAVNIIRANMQRTFSPPDKTVTGFSASSPENNIRPNQPRKYDSV